MALIEWIAKRRAFRALPNRKAFSATLFCALAILLGSPAASGQEARLSDWNGVYEYGYNGGATRGGSPIFVLYKLSISSAAEKASAVLDIAGFQTDQVLVCDVAGDAQELAVKFREYQNGKTENEYGVAEYKVGATLFYLHIDHAKGARRLVTTWAAMTPDPHLPGTSAYFRKTN